MTDDRPEGARGFGPEFWATNYDKLDQMDVVYNADLHARWIVDTFALFDASFSSVIDLGFGLGHLLAALLERHKLFKTSGLEPSPTAFAEGRARVEAVDARTRLVLEQVDLEDLGTPPDHPRDRHDLAVCTSVLQYLSDDELGLVLPSLSRRVKWLYLTVPTDAELDRMTLETGFEDRWAIRRSRDHLRSLIRPCFEPVVGRLLESRDQVDPDKSPFTDELARGW